MKTPKNTTRIRYLFLLVSLIFRGLTSPAWATLDIPVLTWTPRSDWINVKAAPYNAQGDGVTDDTAAIQSALNAVGAYGSPRAVYLPEGTYIISNRLTWAAQGALLVGCGRNTIIKWNGAAGGSMFWANGTTMNRYIGIAWDGNNSAGLGYEHHPVSTAYDSRSVHENESFRNFVGTTINGIPNRALCSSSNSVVVPAAAIIGGFADSGNCPVAEMTIHNCLVVNCAIGVLVANTGANNFQWIIDGCEFQNCSTAIGSSYGMSDIFDTHFEGSTVADIVGGAAVTIRRCTSAGSNLFFTSPFGTGAFPQIIEDCWIDSWTAATNSNPTFAPPFNNTTSKAAITIGNAGNLEVIDCTFTHPPAGCSAVICSTWSYTNTTPISVANNYCPTLAPAQHVTGQLAGSLAGVNLVTIPSGQRPGNLATIGSPYTTFLKTTWPADSTPILDVKQAPYNATGNGITDDTAAIQQAITDAKNANNGSVVYIPATQGCYRITSTLNVSGSNYTIQGSGYKSQLLWYGPTSAGSTMLSLNTPQQIALEQIMLKPQPSNENTAAIVETSTGASSVRIDGVYCWAQASTGNPGASMRNDNGPGLVLSGLPAGSSVYLNHLDGPLTVNDCGRADIFGRWICQGRLIVKGALYPKTGFLGILDWQGGQMQYEDADHWDILVDDNQDLVIGHIYQEYMFNHLKANRGSGTGTGRLTLQGVKQQVQHANDTAILINNYQGRVMYGPQNFYNFASSMITQVGTNPVDVIIPGSSVGVVPPTITMDTGGNYIQTNATFAPTKFPYGYLQDILPGGGLASIAAGHDHQRQLGWEDLKLRYGIWSNITNPSFEADAVNPAPTTTIDCTPAGWTVSNALAAGGGARNCTVVSTASPFGPGSQGLLWVDATGSAAGSTIIVTQNLTPLPANQPAEWSVDFRINSSGNHSDLWIWGFAGGGAQAGGLHISNGGTSCYLGSNINGSDTRVMSPAIDTWYRARFVIGAATAGPSSAILYLTPWTGTGPGTTVAYTVNGISATSNTGLSRIYMYSGTGPGQQQSINLDNIRASNNAATYALP